MHRTYQKSRNSNVDEEADSLMADTLITGTTLVEKESRSIGDIPVGGIIEWDDTFGNLPDGFVLCDGSTVNDPQSSWNGTAVQDLNTVFWTCSGVNFIDSRAAQQWAQSSGVMEGSLTTEGIHFAEVELPEGATVIEAIVYGNAGTWTWDLRRTNIAAGAGSSMATGNDSTASTSITNPVIAKELLAYYFTTTGVSGAEDINGARITYEPRNKFIMRTR